MLSFKTIITVQTFVFIAAISEYSYATQDEIGRWLSEEFTPSSLTPEQQRQELTWFKNASTPFKGMEIRVVSERINTHWYEANVLTKAFEDITGIKVVHEITGEDDVIKKLSAQLDLNYNIYDAYISDSDLIGTHYRSGNVIAISDFIKNEGASVTLPTLDLNDFIGLDFVTGPDNKIYQLPDQQFANLYWYRHDWFQRPELRKRFKARYGYELDVPINWSAYEDIAEFFTVHVKEIDGQRVYGHMDYGLNDPSLGWRFSDAWLSMAGTGDKGLPNGLPVDEWGIRVENCAPVGASVARGGALNAPAAKYALRKYIEWLNAYAPETSKSYNFSDAGPVPGQGHIAQQIFWYTAFTADMIDPTLPVTDDKGIPKWKMAPSPRGPYWEPGMKRGYQDTGAWTFVTSTPLVRRQAAWLYAQFVVSKTVSLKKTLVGLTPIRKSDIFSEALTERAERYGGLVEFYRSQARNSWTPTGTNVPNYPLLADVWWKHIAPALKDPLSVDETMDLLAEAMDARLASLPYVENSECNVQLNPKLEEKIWLDRPGAPKPKRTNEKEPGLTLPYLEALKIWN